LRVRQIASESVEEAASQTSRLEDIERQAILQTLREHGFNRSEAARALGSVAGRCSTSCNAFVNWVTISALSPTKATGAKPVSPN